MSGPRIPGLGLPLLWIQAAGNFSVKVAGAGLAFLVSLLFARTLGAEEYGVYTIAMALANILATVAMLGLPMLVVRSVAVYSESGDWGRLKGIVLVGHGLPAMAGLALVAGGFAVSRWYYPPELTGVVGVALALVPLLALNGVRAAVLRGFHWIITADTPDLLVRPGLVLGLFYVVARQQGGVETAAEALSLQLAATVGALVLGAALLARVFPWSHWRAAPIYQSTAWRRASTVFWVAAVLTIVEGRLGTLLLGWLAGARPAGLYQAAVQLVNLVSFGLVAVGLALQSRLAAAWSAEDRAGAQKLVRDATVAGFALALAFGLVLSLAARPLLGLFGEAFVDSEATLRVLVAGQVLNAMAGSCGVVLAMTGHQADFLKGLVLALAVNLGLGLVLIPGYAHLGAAMAATAGMVTWNGYMAYLAYRRTGLVTLLVPARFVPGFDPTEDAPR